MINTIISILQARCIFRITMCDPVHCFSVIDVCGFKKLAFIKVTNLIETRD